MAAANQYLKRMVVAAVEEALEDTPVVCLLGPRQCGKTTLVIKLAPERAYFSLDDANLLQAAKEDPQGFLLQLPERVTIDEVQRVPELLLAIKRSVDENRLPGRFLLTGSANLLAMPQLADSLAGRMEVVYLHPFAEVEKEKGNGDFLEGWLSLGLKPSLIPRRSGETFDLPDRIVYGGYPEPNRRKIARARQWHRQYLRAIIERDIHDVARVKEGGDVLRLLEMLAFRNAKLLNVTELSKALRLDRQTVERYLSILEKVFLVRRLPAWHRNAAKRLVKTPKVYLCDSGIAATLSELKPDDWNARRSEFGHLLEAFVVQQLIAEAGWTDLDLRFWHYRDKDKVEVDCVITRGSKVWGVEVKAAATVRSSDGKGLRRLAEQVGEDFQSGIVLYEGSSILSLGSSKLWAVPFSELWKGFSDIA